MASVSIPGTILATNLDAISLTPVLSAPSANSNALGGSSTSDSLLRPFKPNTHHPTDEQPHASEGNDLTRSVQSILSAASAPEPSVLLDADAALHASSSSHRHHPYGGVATSLPSRILEEVVDDSSVKIGPVRSRRGQHMAQLSLASNSTYASLNPISDSDDESDGREERQEGDENKNPDGSDTNMRTVKVEGHAFKIPLESPTVAPQLQANVRLTSTGKPSHARKVPDDHIKRPRNAFILFRSYACTANLLPPSLGITDHRQVSRIVGQLWRGLKPEEKQIWERKAQEEKEAHKLKNPNYRYRPQYRRDDGVRRRRVKEDDVKEIEEEERKCEVVARVLLEGRDVTNEELDQEVASQRQKDQDEGRQRGQRSRSRSRSRSINSSGQSGNQFRHASAPSGDNVNGDSGAVDYDLTLLQPLLNAQYGRSGRRSQTMPSSGQTDFSLPITFPNYTHHNVDATGINAPFAGFVGFGSRFGSVSSSNSMAAPLPSPRTIANMQHLVDAMDSQGTTSVNATNSALTYQPGFKSAIDDNVTLLSPSFSRKFSLGRWEVPGVPHAHNAFAQNAASQTLAPAPQIPGHNYDAYGSSTQSMQYQSYDAQNIPVQPYSNANGAEAPTYVYLSKADAQNPQIVEHYLSQGFGVSFDV